jgi:PAS domain S-box-containing protein
LHINGVYLPPIEERQLLCKDGTIKDIEVSSRVIQYQVRPAITGIARDITERKKIEEQLRESEERLKGFMDAATDSFSLWDSELNLVDANKTGLDTFLPGTDKTEIIGKNISEFHTHPEDIKSYKKVLITGKPFIADRIAPPQQYGDIVLSVKAFKLGEGLGIITNDITKQKRMENALRKSEEKLRGFRDAATDAFSLWDSELNLIDINETGLELLPAGTKKKDIIGRNIREFITDERNITNYKKVLRTGKAFTGDRIFHDSMLGERIVSVKAFKVEEDLGLISTDISERKKAEEELKKTKMRLEYLLKSCPAVVYSCTPDGHFETTFMSENIREILGFKAEYFINKPEFWERNLHPDERGHVTTTFSEISKKGYYSEAYRFKHKNGSYRWMLEEANLIHDDNGNPLEIVGFWTDITERKQTEEALRESEEKFRSIFENSPIGMALATLDFKFNKVNAALCRMLEYEERELTQMTFLDITHEEYRDLEEKYAKKLTNGKISSYQTEKKYLKKNQDIFWARVTISLLRDDKGAPINYIAMVENITALKHKEEEIKRQLLKYNVEDGNIYLITEETPTLSQTVFKDLTSVGYEGFIISRTPERDYRTQVKEKFDFFWLTEKNGYNHILIFIEKVPNKSVILIDRLEYLFLKEGPENAMRFVYKLRETTYLKNLIVIMSIDDTTLSEREIHILEKESLPIEPRFMAKIPEEFLEILRLIYQQNNLGLKPSYSDVGEELQISKPTVRKRIKQLIATGYVIEHKKGKSKILEINGKGRSLFIK